MCQSPGYEVLQLRMSGLAWLVTTHGVESHTVQSAWSSPLVATRGHASARHVGRFGAKHARPRRASAGTEQSTTACELHMLQTEYIVLGGECHARGV